MTIFPCPCRVLPIKRIKENNDSKASTHYQDCCESLHKREAFAQSAEQLMRSRYSAFVLGLTDYIVETTLPAQQVLLDKQSISDWAKMTDWAGLEVVQHHPKVGKRHAQVEFKAFYTKALKLGEGIGELDVHHERSAFVEISHKRLGSAQQQQRSQQYWYFLDPTVDMSRMNVSQKQPCICGSGEKFKRCCGPYL